MAHSAQINVNGVLTTVTEFDNSAQAIDDAVSNMGAAATPQAALAALGAGVRTNLLINPYFINQRGQSSYSGSGYNLDMAIGAANLTVTVNDGQITLTGSSNTGVSEIFFTGITNWADVAGKTFTASILTASGNIGIATYQMPVQSPSGTTSFANQPIPGGGKIYIFWGSTQGLGLQIAANNTSITIPKGGIKLEEGEGQTLAYQDSTGAWHRLPQPEDGDYAGQLLKCQQYLLPLGGISGVGVGSSTTRLWIMVPTPIEMRTTPVVVGDISIYPTGPSITSVSVSHVNANCIRLYFDGTGIVANAAYSINPTNAFLSAQL